MLGRRLPHLWHRILAWLPPTGPRCLLEGEKRDDQRLLPHVKPGDGPADDHPLDFQRALENREARGVARSLRR